MILRPLILAVLATAFGIVSPVKVQADTVLATCKTGGCTCALSPLSGDEITLVLGTPAKAETSIDPTAATLVYEPDLGSLAWVTAPLRDIHARFGGVGDCPIALFPAPDAMVPLDGTWQWQTLGETTSGCPAALGGMLAASRVEFISTPITWDGAFHPDRLSSTLPRPDMAGDPYEWREVGPYRWLSDNVQRRDCSDGTCAEIALTLQMTMVAPDRISGFLALRSAIDAPQAAILAGFGLAECRVRVRYDIIRTGP